MGHPGSPTGTYAGEQNHVTPSIGGPTFLKPLARLLQRVLLPQDAGADGRFRFRRYFWLLKRYHQRRRQTAHDGQRLPAPLAQLGGHSPLEGLPLEDSPLRRLLQHRGPG